MNAYNRSWLLGLLMVITGVSEAVPVIPPNQDSNQNPVLPTDKRCSLSASHSVVDYGVISRWQLKDMGAGRVSPGSRSLMVNIVCPYSREMRLRVEGSRNEQKGLHYGGQGAIRLRLLDAQLDGNPVDLRTVTSGGVITGNEEHTLTLNSGQWVAPVMRGRVIDGKMLTVRLVIQPLLGESDVRVTVQQRSETLLTLTLDE